MFSESSLAHFGTRAAGSGERHHRRWPEGRAERERASATFGSLEASSLDCGPQAFQPHPYLRIFILVHAPKVLTLSENPLAYFGRFGRFGSFSLSDVTSCKVTDSAPAGAVSPRICHAELVEASLSYPHADSSAPLRLRAVATLFTPKSFGAVKRALFPV
jgi:hypothetical protein